MNYPLKTNLPANPAFKDAPTLKINAAGTSFAYRAFGPEGDVPLICLNHWGAVLDNFDPRIMDGLAANRRLIAIDYRGIGSSGGSAPLTVAEMARDTIALIRALGFNEVDLFGFSLGGFVAQEIALQQPNLVRKIMLTGTGPAGGFGIAKVGAISWPLIIKGMLSFKDPKFFLFFTRTANGQHGAAAFLKRLKERKSNRDKGPTPRAFSRQLKAITAWGKQEPQDLSSITKPVLVANGDNDIMVPTINSQDLAKRIAGAKLVIYPDAGHGGIFQYHDQFIETANAFLAE